jgi:hypothetical protein
MRANIILESLKLKRTKVFLTIAFFFIISMLWGGALIFAYIPKASHANFYLIIYIMAEINTLFLPVAIATFCSRIFSVERKGGGIKNLMINGKSIWKLFLAKLEMSIVFFLLVNFIEIIIFVLLSEILSIKIDAIALFLQFLGVSFSILVLSLVHLGISFVFAQPIVSIAIGVLGAFIAFMIERLSMVIQIIIPWGVIGVLSPARYELQNNQMNYIQSENLLLKYALVFGVTIGYYFISKMLIHGRGSYELLGD